MFERFTDQARRVVVLAQEEARMLGHGYIGTEHILLGLAREGEGVGVQVLDRLGVSTDRVLAEVPMTKRAAPGEELRQVTAARMMGGRPPAGTTAGLREVLTRLNEIGDRLTAIENLLAEMHKPAARERKPASGGARKPPGGQPKPAGAQRNPPAGGAEPPEPSAAQA
jgi:ATP-dependent Clp protease ATP-binding subunit ClpA